jgi:hypothetical protein
MPINYTDDLLNTISDDGLNQELRDLLYEDSKFLSKLNVANDRQRNLAFFLDNFCDDLCEEFGHSDVQDRGKVILLAFNNLKERDNVDLTDIRGAVLKALKNLFKLAYPNSMGVNESNKKEERDIDRWIKALKEIYDSMRSGESYESSSKRAMEEWSPMEQYDFKAWSRYYAGGNHEKYNVKKVAQKLELPIPPQGELDNIQPEVKERTPKTLPELKNSLLSRLNAAERILYNFAQVWPDNIYSRLHQGLSDLKREIMLMRTLSSINDRIIRVASIWEKEGFDEGARELKKIAQPPLGGEDITSEIEKALTGREYEDKAPPPGDEAMPPPGGEAMPPPPGGEAMPPLGDPLGDIGEGPPEGVTEELPPMKEPPGLEDEEKKEVGMDPYADATVQDVLNILEPLTQKLSNREFIRDLSKVDMMLDALKVASHFPELGEAISKSLELSLYVGSRLEKIISKLKGGLEEEEEEKEKEEPVAPSVEMDELEKKPEETAIEVTEEEAMAAPLPPPPTEGGEMPPPAAPPPPAGV